MRMSLAGCLLCLSLSACTTPPTQPGPGASLQPCGVFPNCVNSHSGEGVHAVPPLQANSAQWLSLKNWLRQQESWELVIQDDYFVQAVVVSPLMGYRDDVQLQYQPDTQQIHVRSSSRLGVGDMGANRARVEQLRSVLVQSGAQ